MMIKQISGNKTLKIGIIGTGAIGQDHIKRCTNFLSGVEVVAVSDIDKKSAQNAISIYGLDAKAYESGNDLIQAKEVDAIIIASSGKTHAEYILSGIEAKKFIFCEKPLAMTIEECQAIIETEQTYGKRLVQVGFMRSYDRRYQELKKIIQDKKLGQILMIHAAHRNQECPENFTSEMVITDTLIHELDIFRWLLNDEFVTVSMIPIRKTSKAPKGLQDPQFALLETQSGIRINVELFVNCQYGYDIKCEIVGEEGVASLPAPAAVSICQHEKRYDQILANWQDWFLEAYNIEIQEFINECLVGKLQGPDAWRGYMATYVAEFCIESQKKGQEIAIPVLKCPDFYRSDNKIE